MSILADARATALRLRQDEVKSIAAQHRARLRSLYHIHSVIQNNTSLSALINDNIDSIDPDADEISFLNENDLSHGFNPKALTLLSGPPTPQLQRDHDSISTSKLSSDHALLSGSTPQIATVDAPAQNGAVAVPAAHLDHSASHTDATGRNASAALPVTSSGAAKPVVDIQTGSVNPNDQGTTPAEVAPPLPEDVAALPGTGQQYLDQQTTEKPADTVHLPPKEVQEERLRERQTEEQERKQSNDSRTSRLAAPHTEAASSPSSTVAHSVTTPQPTQETSDTSPDSEDAHEELTPPKDLQPSPDEQRRKKEHDRHLEAQKELARQKGLDEVALTPDDQLRLEEREAAARDAEERAAREDVGGPEHDSKGDHNSTEAAQVVEEMEADDQRRHKVEDSSADAKPAVEDAAQVESVTVAPSQKASLSAPAPSRSATPRSQRATPAEPAEKHSTPAPGRREGMTTRVSSGAMRHKSVSEILGNSQSPATESHAQKENVSPMSISPVTHRHPQDTPRTLPPSRSQQLTRTSPSTRTHGMSTSALEQLDVLKGAASDPEKDYLESLFRIQAHDLQGSGTKALPDLLKTGRKILTTEDHFTAMHERLDFRMLRRIYQLQNANKWSLRQMEKVKEPEQPVTHHDHMMEEMKWMRKDFKAERKMKKSICASLARSCAEWVAADLEGRKRLQVKIKSRDSTDTAEGVPELEQAGDSAAEDDPAPGTPREGTPLPITLVVVPELEESVKELEKIGRLSKALKSLPQTGLLDQDLKFEKEPITKVSKFIGGKVLPKASKPPLKRSRYEYEDEAELVESQPSNKRMREEVPPEDPECALFHPDNKPIRDRLHSNNAFRPPSEFIMPSISFYEFRTGSQWIWEDDQKLRKLAKEYSFNWSLISDEMALPSRYKSSAERRTPWECFERWVELESLPADMRKTVYFKTWFQRLEQSQQAAEQRYQRQVQHIQQAQTGQVPPRRRTIPTRVEKRRSARYLWMVDGFRKLAKKREQAAWKQAETARAAAQRKSQAEANPVQKMVKMTPQEFSKKRQERDQQAAEHAKQQRLKYLEAHRQQLAARQNAMQQQQQGMANGMPNQQRPQGPHNPAQQAQMQPNGQQVPNMNGQANGQQQLRPGVPMAPQRNGHLAPPQVGPQGMPQAQMQARMMQHPNMQQQIAQANAQGRSAQYPNQQLQMANGNMQSPGGSMNNQQQLQQNAALLQALNQQQQSMNGHQTPNGNQTSTPQQMSASPSMPPPPTPQSSSQQLSSGHVPQIVAIKDRIRAQNPNISEADLMAMATAQMKQMSQSQMQSQTHSMSQMRQSAMSAAAGIPSQAQNGMQQQQQYTSNQQGAYQRNGQMVNGMNGSGVYTNGDGNNQQANLSPAPNSSSPTEQQRQQMYKQQMYRQQLQATQSMQMPSPHANHAQLNGSPGVAHASPNMTPASPSMQLANNNGNQMNGSGGMGTPTGVNGQRPPSRSNTPQMQQRLGSAGSGQGGMGNGMQSPGAMQGSPRNMQASMAR